MDEVSLREIIEAVLKRKLFIAITVIICIIIGLFGSMIIMPSSLKSEIIISLSYAGIEKGVNPDGSKFNYNLMISPKVIQNAIDEFDFSSQITVDNIKRNIKVEPIIPDSVVERIANMLKAGQELSYNPSEFLVQLSIPKSLSLTSQEGALFLDALADSYSEFFHSTYSEKKALSNVVKALDFNTYDYPEITIIMNEQVDFITEYLKSVTTDNKELEKDSTLTKENKIDINYRSERTGMAISDIIKSLEVFKNIDINRLNSLISSNLLTKNKEQAIIAYEYRIKTYELEKAKLDSEFLVAKDVMAKYNTETNKILIPGLNTSKEELMKLADERESYYDELADRATEAGVDALKKAQDIEFAKKELERLKNDTVSAETKKSAEKDVQVLLASVKQSLDTHIQMINDTMDDFFIEKYGNTVTTLSPAQSSIDSKLLQILAISVLLGLMIGFFTAFFMEYWKKSGASIKQIQA